MINMQEYVANLTDEQLLTLQQLVEQRIKTPYKTFAKANPPLPGEGAAQYIIRMRKTTDYGLLFLKNAWDCHQS